MVVTNLQQIYLNSTDSTGVKQWEKLHSALVRTCPSNLWPKDSYQSACPMPILISRAHYQQLEILHEALTIALNDIVERWWTDRDARFPERMPLEKEEEDLLKVSICSALFLI